MKRAATQHVDVDVEDGLPGPGTIIDHRTITLRIEPPLTGQLSRHKKEVAEQGLVFRCSLPERRNVFSWEDQQMDRRLRMNVLDRDRLFVLMHYFGGNLAIDNLAEEAISH